MISSWDSSYVVIRSYSIPTPSSLPLFRLNWSLIYWKISSVMSVMVSRVTTSQHLSFVQVWPVSSTIVSIAGLPFILCLADIIIDLCLRISLIGTSSLSLKVCSWAYILCITDKLIHRYISNYISLIWHLYHVFINH